MNTKYIKRFSPWIFVYFLFLILIPTVSVLPLFKPIPIIQYLGILLLIISVIFALIKYLILSEWNNRLDVFRIILIFIICLVFNRLDNESSQSILFFSCLSVVFIANEDIKTFNYNLFCLILSSIVIFQVFFYISTNYFFLTEENVNSLNVGIFSQGLIYPSAFLLVGVQHNFTKKNIVFFFSSVALSFVFIFSLIVNARLAWGGLVIVGVILYVLFLKKKRIKPFFILVAGISLFIFEALFLAKVDSIKGRLLIYKITIKAISEKPFGYGFDSFQNVYPYLQAQYFKNNHHQSEYLLANSVSHTFNEFLQIQFELGILGTFAFAGFVIFLIYRFYIFCKIRTYNLFILGSYCCFFVFLLQCLFSYPLQNPYCFFLLFPSILPCVQSAFNFNYERKNKKN